MILIESLKYYEVERNIMKIRMKSVRPHDLIRTAPSGEEISVKEAVQLVQGRRFVRPSDGTDVFVGLSADVADILGLQYEAWENMEKDLQEYRESHYRSAALLAQLFNASLWTRIKWLFTGVK